MHKTLQKTRYASATVKPAWSVHGKTMERKTMEKQRSVIEEEEEKKHSQCECSLSTSFFR